LRARVGHRRIRSVFFQYLFGSIRRSCC
jgi:hypothetical protein